MKKLNPLEIKRKIMKIGLKTGASHIASALSCVDILVPLYKSRPDEIIILSKGHGALAQYVILNAIGKLPDKILDTYYQDGGLSIHSTLMPEYGIYASTGSLGHGLGIGIGYAIANPDRQVWVILSDGELDCGSTLESMRIILKLGLKNVFVVVDENGWQAFSKFNSEALSFRYRSYYSKKGEGWGELENTLKSHYTKVDKNLYKVWNKNIKVIEKEKQKMLREYKKAFKSKKT